ncbi:MAG TPA: hypothetical protein PK513_10120, partial [Alphaproteobacteria bacterium]|nr:hypothetical protein [Alphaproteobacteria bacterium]
SVGVNRVIVDQDELQIDINPLKMRQLLQTHLNLVISEKSALPNLMISVPFTIRRAYRGAIQIQSDHTETDFLDMQPTQLKNLIRGIIWREEHFAGMAMGDIAKSEGLSKAGIRKIIMGSFDVLMAI